MELTLPAHLSLCLDEIVKLLDDNVRRDVYQLGGGTALRTDSDDFIIDASRKIIGPKYTDFTSSVVLRDIVQHMMRYDFEKAQTQIDRVLGAND